MGITGDDGVAVFEACTVVDNEFVGRAMLVGVAVCVGSWDGALVVADDPTTVGGIKVAGEVGIRVDLAVGGGSGDAIPHAHNTSAVHAVAKAIGKLRTIPGSTFEGRFNPVGIRIVKFKNVRAIIDRSKSVRPFREVYTESCGFVQLFEVLQHRRPGLAVEEFAHSGFSHPSIPINDQVTAQEDFHRESLKFPTFKEVVICALVRVSQTVIQA